MFEGWDEFYLMIGSAAGALIGLLFVVVTLTQGRERSTVMRGVALYMTPTAVHFSVVVSISAIALVPKLTAVPAALGFGLAAIVGLANSLRACLGIRGLTTAADPPHWTDLWFYGLVPTALYLGLGGVAVALGVWADWADHATAMMLLALLLLGVRNAWDLITWMAPQGAVNPK